MSNLPGAVPLKSNALSRLDSALIAVAGTGPANSLAVSTAVLVGAVGFFGPGSLLFGAISMLGIALAYYYLNAWRSDAGASYAWVGRSLHPALGFMAGWSVLVANALFMVAGSLPAASATLDLVNPKLDNDVGAVTVVGALWFAAIATIVLVGIKATARFQKAVTAIEITGVLGLAGAGFAKAAVHHSGFSLTWFSPLGPGSPSAFVAGAVVALFYYWGWDISANLSEETVDRNRTPGIGGLSGMFVILALFLLAQVSIQLVLSPRDIAAANANVLNAFADAVFPRPWGDLAVVIVIISTVGTLETSLLAVSRTLLSMGRDRVLGPRFARLHPVFATPWFGSIAFACVALALFGAAAASPSVNSILAQSVNAVGIALAVYYGLSGIACACYYRTTFRQNPTALWLRGIWPAAAGIFLWIVAIAQVGQAGVRGSAVTLVLLAVGIVPLVYYRLRYRSEFYTSPLETCPKEQLARLPATEAT